MGAITAQILVGRKHTYEGGLVNISHELHLTENDAPAWVITSKSSGESASAKQQRVFIPTLQNMLEDGLLMIGLYALKDELLNDMAAKYIQSSNQGRVVLYNDMKQEQLAEMYQRSRELDAGHKLVITVLDGSSIRKQVDVLEKYQMDVEICVPVFKRELNPWNGIKESKTVFKY